MCMCTLLRYSFLLFRYEKKYFLCFTFINFTVYSPFTFDISYYKVIVTNVLKYYVRCLTSQESNRREALNTLAKQNPVTILPAIPLPRFFCQPARLNELRIMSGDGRASGVDYSIPGCIFWSCHLARYYTSILI